MDWRHRTNGQPATAPLRRRLHVWAHRWRLDAELADGADPARDPVLAYRAAQLMASAARHRLAAGLRNLIVRADHPTNTVVPVARSSVRAERGHLLELAERLDGDGEVGVRGVASTSVLLTDGRSPLWWRSEVEELHDAVEAALIGLGCPAWAT